MSARKCNLPIALRMQPLSLKNIFPVCYILGYNTLQSHWGLPTYRKEVAYCFRRHIHHEEERNRVFRVAVNRQCISSQPIGLCLSQMSLLFVNFVVETPFLGAFAKLRTLTNRKHFLVCPCGGIPFPLDGFSWNLILEYFSKIYQGNTYLIKL
jgi:hypothetical protein